MLFKLFEVDTQARDTGIIALVCTLF